MLLTLLSGCTARTSSQPKTSIEPFALFGDQRYFDLTREKFNRGAVLVAFTCECPILRKMLPKLEMLSQKFAAQGIAFYLIDPKVQDTPQRIRDELEQTHSHIPVLYDPSQIGTRSLGLHSAAEAVLIDMKDLSVVYHGAITDNINFDGEKPEGRQYLEDALTNFVGGSLPAVQKTIAAGCAFSLAADEHFTFYQDVEPILRQRCLTCHTQGRVAPTSMESYEDVVGWGPEIRHQLRMIRMPPESVDPNFGSCRKPNLKPDEIHALVSWTENGMPKGDPALGPKRHYDRPPRPLWTGDPDHYDLKFEMPTAVEVPPQGEFTGSLYLLERSLNEDIWVKQIKYLTNPDLIVHTHLVVVPEKELIGQELGLRNRNLHAKGIARSTGQLYGLRTNAVLSPITLDRGTAIMLPKGSSLLLDVNHKTTGKVEMFSAGIGLVRADCNQPLHRLYYGNIYARDFVIPANTPTFKVKWEKPVQEDIKVYRILFHMHKRGRAIKLTAVYPDGSLHPVLSKPNFIYQHDRSFALDPPMAVPKGSKFLAEAEYDNSSANPLNPNPNAEVGEGVNVDTKEMMEVFYHYTVDQEPPHFESCKGRKVGSKNE